MKYIIVQPMLCGQPDGEPQAILFPTRLLHKEIAMCHDVNSLIVISAGSCQRNESDGSIRTFGYSESLQISSRKEDAIIIENAIRGQI